MSNIIVQEMLASIVKLQQCTKLIDDAFIPSTLVTEHAHVGTHVRVPLCCVTACELTEIKNIHIISIKQT